MGRSNSSPRKKVEEMKSKGWTVVGDKPIPPKPKAKKEIE